jgi:hypothetical protein
VWDALRIAAAQVSRLVTGPLNEPGAGLASWSLPPTSFSAGRARRLAHARLIGWGLDGFTDMVGLLVSELVSNALRHAPGPIRLTLWLTDGTLRCEVVDTSTELPSMRDCDPYDEGGRGLLLLDMLTCCWGSTRMPDGKAVWFELPTSVPAES